LFGGRIPLTGYTTLQDFWFFRGRSIVNDMSGHHRRC
jgi:hypothetical protein